MIIRSAFLATNAQLLDNGLLNVAGAGWSTYDVGRFPDTVRGVFVSLVELERSEEGANTPLTFSTKDPGGQVVSSAGSMIVQSIPPAEKKTPGSPVRLWAVFPFVFAVYAPGDGAVSLHDQFNQELVSMRFSVVERPDIDPLPKSGAWKHTG